MLEQIDTIPITGWGSPFNALATYEWVPLERIRIPQEIEEGVLSMGSSEYNRLLISIMLSGFTRPLEVESDKDNYVLVGGFKRFNLINSPLSRGCFDWMAQVTGLNADAVARYRKFKSLEHSGVTTLGDLFDNKVPIIIVAPQTKAMRLFTDMRTHVSGSHDIRKEASIYKQVVSELGLHTTSKMLGLQVQTIESFLKLLEPNVSASEKPTESTPSSNKRKVKFKPKEGREPLVIVRSKNRITKDSDVVADWMNAYSPNQAKALELICQEYLDATSE